MSREKRTNAEVTMVLIEMLSSSKIARVIIVVSYHYCVTTVVKLTNIKLMNINLLYKSRHANWVCTKPPQGLTSLLIPNEPQSLRVTVYLDTFRGYH